MLLQKRVVCSKLDIYVFILYRYVDLSIVDNVHNPGVLQLECVQILQVDWRWTMTRIVIADTSLKVRSVLNRLALTHTCT